MVIETGSYYNRWYSSIVATSNFKSTNSGTRIQFLIPAGNTTNYISVYYGGTNKYMVSSSYEINVQNVSIYGLL